MVQTLLSVDNDVFLSQRQRLAFGLGLGAVHSPLTPSLVDRGVGADYLG